MTAKSLALLLTLATAASSGAQTWSRSYEAGLEAARANNWIAAREAFQKAAADRPDDRSGPTVLPGPATERRLWREGAPYSPNFLAAYSLYRRSLKTTDGEEAATLLNTAASEMETLVAKDQTSAEALFYLDVIYTRLDDQGKRKALGERVAKLDRRPDFKVDTEIVAPEEIAALQARTSATQIPGKPNAPTLVGPGPLVGDTNPAVIANVPPLLDKFAFIVGQTNSRLAGGLISFAEEDVDRVRSALIDFAGYPADNVVLLKNATASEMKAAADSLAGKMTDGNTVTIFFAGAGVNLDGKDYLAGTDTQSAGDVASMVAKPDLFLPFVKRNARVFAFFEANRPMDAGGNYFGRERVSVGSVSEVYSTIAGESAPLTYRDNKPMGLFGSAFVLTLADMRSNQLPIYNFTWQVVERMRRGGTGTTGGGGGQVCVLPILRRIASDAKF